MEPNISINECKRVESVHMYSVLCIYNLHEMAWDRN